MNKEQEIIDRLIDENYELFKGGVNKKVLINNIFQEGKKQSREEFNNKLEQLKKNIKKIKTKKSVIGDVYFNMGIDRALEKIEELRK